MKTLLSTLFVLFVVCAHSNEPNSNMHLSRFIADLFVEETTGYLEPATTTKDGSHLNTIVLPSYYDFDLVRLSTRNIVNKYKDLTVRLQWRALDADNSFYTLLNLEYDNEIITVSIMYYHNKVFVLI
jgi:hypothetical protein